MVGQKLSLRQIGVGDESLRCHLRLLAIFSDDHCILFTMDVKKVNLMDKRVFLQKAMIKVYKRGWSLLVITGWPVLVSSDINFKSRYRKRFDPRGRFFRLSLQ